MPKHTQRSKVTPHISYGRVAVETQSENRFALDWELEVNSTLKQNFSGKRKESGVGSKMKGDAQRTRREARTQ